MPQYLPISSPSQSLAIFDRLLKTKNASAGLTDIQSFVLQKVCQGYTYQQIADEAAYDHDYIKHVASHLWRSLSKATSQKVSKSNIQSVLLRYQDVELQNSQPGWLQQASPTSSNAAIATLPCLIEDVETRWVGRSALIQSLSQMLQTHCRVLSLMGLTGIGKSALAVRLTQEPELSHRWNDPIIIHCDRKPDFLMQLASKILESAALDPLSDSNDQDPIAVIVTYLQTHPTLVIFDRVEVILSFSELGVVEYTHPQMQTFLDQVIKAEQMPSRILLTTQYQPPPLVEGRYPLRSHQECLSGLTVIEGIELFQVWELKPQTEQEQGYLEQIIQAYEGHPLTLKVIIEEILSIDELSSIQAYWAEYGVDILTLQTHKLQELIPGVTEESSAYHSMRLTHWVKPRVERSLYHLRIHQPLAHQLLCIGATCPYAIERCEWLALIHNIPKSERVIAFQVLQQQHLVLRDTSNAKVQHYCHPLIREIALNHFDQAMLSNPLGRETPPV